MSAFRLTNHLQSIVAIYRLSVMHYRIDSLRGPNPLDSSTAKATFYTFHILPEWLAVLVLCSVNVRKTFGTALFGDWRWRHGSKIRCMVGPA